MFLVQLNVKKSCILQHLLNSLDLYVHFVCDIVKDSL